MFGGNCTYMNLQVSVLSDTQLISLSVSACYYNDISSGSRSKALKRLQVLPCLQSFADETV